MKLNIYGKVADAQTQEQIENISKSKAFEGQNIAIMPDNHMGKGACVGFTATFEDKIIPNVVGVDVGCGMAMLKMPKWFVEKFRRNKIETLKVLQNIIRKHVPHGFKTHEVQKEWIVAHFKQILNKLTFELKEHNLTHIINSVGTLGGGNHFIELNENENGELFLVVHSGSRNLGQLVAKHHQNIAERNFKEPRISKEELMSIEPQKRKEFIDNFHKQKNEMPSKGLEYLIGSQVEDYLNDMKIAQEYAEENRNEIIINIVENLFKEFDIEKEIIPIRWMISHTIHNYIDIENKIIRKGAIFADEYNDVIIPLNMRDGSIIARGIGNKKANFSAPHGAGRLMSRTEAKNIISFEYFKETMKDVVSWTVSKNTLDEAPMAYKSKEEIINGLQGLVKIKEIIKPVFNFKDDTGSER